MPRKKKIAVVVPKYGLVGGGEIFVRELTERLAQNATYDIHVLANQWQSDSSRITFHRIPIITFPKWLTTVSFAWFVERKLKEIKPDIVHAHDRIFKADIATVHSIPHRIWVKEIRRKRIPNFFDLATSWVERKMFTQGDCKYVLPVSTLAARKNREEYPAGDYLVKVLHPGVDERFFVADTQFGVSVRKEFGISESDFLILFVGMNFELKGLDQLLAIMGRLRKKNLPRRPKLLVVGKGNREKYEHVARGYGIHDDVLFAGIRHDMPAVYSASDILVLLSGFDTFGMVVTEAMASGLPVIVSDNVGASDLIREGKNGFVVNREWSTDQIATKIVELAANDERMAAMSREARQAAAGQSWEEVAGKVEAVYERLLRDSGGISL